VGPDGIAFDFKELGRIVKERVIEILDHSNLNDVIEQPSAERIAQWTWKRLEDLPLAEIRVWESDCTFVTYSGGDDSGGDRPGGDRSGGDRSGGDD